MLRPGLLAERQGRTRRFVFKPACTFTFVDRSSADVEAAQGVCSSDGGTTMFTAAGNYIQGDRTLIYKWTRSGTTWTPDATNPSADIELDANAPALTQLNSLYYDEPTGLILAGANNFETSDDLGWIIRINPADLSVVDYAQVSDATAQTAEGCSIALGYLWQTFHDYHGVYRFVVTNAAQGAFALSLQAHHPFPDADPGSPYYQQALWVGAVCYVNPHGQQVANVMRSYYWNGTSFELIHTFARQTTFSTQGFTMDSSGNVWFAERLFDTGDHRVARATLTCP